MCEWIVQNMPEIAAQSGDQDEEKVEMYICENPKMIPKVLDQVYSFLKEKKVTHYVSAIDLGAAVYSVSLLGKRKKTRGAHAGAGVDILAGIEAGARYTLEAMHKVSRRHRIGDIDNVKRASGEGVIGYKLLPIFTLINEKHRKGSDAECHSVLPPRTK